MKLILRTLTLAAAVVALTAGPANATPFQITIGDSDWFGSGLPAPGGPGPWSATVWDTTTALDNRSAAEAGATDGAQLTDLYSSIAPVDWCNELDQLPGGGTTPDCSPNGGEGSFVFSFFGELQSASIVMMLGDFQCNQFGELTVTVNDISQAFCYSHGYQMAGLESFVLTPEMIAAANLTGQVVMRVQNPGNSFDYITFDFASLVGDTDLTQSFDPVVPEPGTLALFGTGMVIVWGGARRRARAKKA